MTGDSWPHFERAEQKGGCYPFQDHLLIELYWLFRYFRVSPAVERQQTIWVVVGITIGILLKYGFYLPGLFFPPLCTNICFCASRSPLALLCSIHGYGRRTVIIARLLKKEGEESIGAQQ
jgi:hypothetical protein